MGTLQKGSTLVQWFRQLASTDQPLCPPWDNFLPNSISHTLSTFFIWPISTHGPFIWYWFSSTLLSQWHLLPLCFSQSSQLDIFGVVTKCPAQHCTYYFSWLSTWMAQLQPHFIIFHTIRYFLALCEITWSWLCIVLTELILVKSVSIGLQMNP